MAAWVCLGILRINLDQLDHPSRLKLPRFQLTSVVNIDTWVGFKSSRSNGSGSFLPITSFRPVIFRPIISSSNDLHFFDVYGLFGVILLTTKFSWFCYLKKSKWNLKQLKTKFPTFDNLSTKTLNCSRDVMIRN